MVQKFSFDHVGWITKNVELFERFWVDILGFSLVASSTLGAERAKVLFDIDADAEIRRYQLDDMIVEIHNFFDQTISSNTTFNREGINHICLFVQNRAQFVTELPPGVKIHTYKHKGGWENIFITDFEGNWIELRTKI